MAAMNNSAQTLMPILSQFDQKTQIQALEMLRQLNAQQQIHHMSQMQHLRDLQHQAHIHARAAAAAAQIKAAQQQAKQSHYIHPEDPVEDVSVDSEPKFFTAVDGEQVAMPDDFLIEQIVNAAEHYFSDDNLVKDHYLLRQICQKSEGYLSLKLLTALKTIKRLTKDWRVTSFALQKSSRKLKLNNEKTKVKRVAVLPEHVLNARQITSVIAIKIPDENSSVRQITQMFAEFGKISLVRVLMPGRQVPCDLRNYATQVPDMGESLCAIVEYETETEACFACRELNGKRMGSGLRAALLGPRLRRNLYKAPLETDVVSSVKPIAPTWSSKVAQPTTPGQEPKRDSGCDTASSHSSGSTKGKSPPQQRKKFDRAPGAGRKTTKMIINVQSVGNIARQPRGPIGNGFELARTVV